VKRKEFHDLLWQKGLGSLQTGSEVAIAGAGISGLHLAEALVGHGYRVSVFEPEYCGGLRVPMMHACHAAKPRPELWQKATGWSRLWYTQLPFSTGAVEMHEGDYGQFFTIRTRQYLRDLRDHVRQSGAQYVRKRIDFTEARHLGFSAFFIATGQATQSTLNAIMPGAAQLIVGGETYFGNVNSDPVFPPEDLTRLAAATNFMRHGRRAAFIHRNGETAAEAGARAALMYSKKRAYFFGGVRLASRDRLPVVGCLPGPNAQPYFFTAMGYHAMTYAPYLATKFASWLAGKDDEDRNLICGLTPARFIPRENIGKLRAADVNSI